MRSMCHYCGAELAKSIEEKRKQDNGNAVISSTGDPIWSCKLCCERKGRDFVKQDGITPYATPMISPIFSMSCSNRSYSSCSDFSVDINSYDQWVSLFSVTVLLY